jgi:hypothetical protein
LSRCTSNADRESFFHNHLPTGDMLPKCSLPVPEWFVPDRK